MVQNSTLHGCKAKVLSFLTKYITFLTAKIFYKVNVKKAVEKTPYCWSGQCLSDVIVAISCNDGKNNNCQDPSDARYSKNDNNNEME